MAVVAVIGASNDPSRYSYKAMKMLEDYGHTAIPVNPKEELICGKKVVHDLKNLTSMNVDTLTFYVKGSISDKYLEDIISVAPRRVIFNPGAENDSLAKSLSHHNIDVEYACTLVLLRTGQF